MTHGVAYDNGQMNDDDADDVQPTNHHVGSCLPANELNDQLIVAVQ